MKKDLIAYLFLFGIPCAVWFAINFTLNILGISIYYGDEGQFRYADGVAIFLWLCLLPNSRVFKTEMELHLEDFERRRRGGEISNWRGF